MLTSSVRLFPEPKQHQYHILLTDSQNIRSQLQFFVLLAQQNVQSQPRKLPLPKWETRSWGKVLNRGLVQLVEVGEDLV